MEQIASGYRGLSILMNINADRLLCLAALALALRAGAFVGSL